jgi:O-antigen/teichoic acid export membrane protein
MGVTAGFGQAIAALCSPVIARLYAPDEFALLGLYTALLGPLTVIAPMRYESAIPLPREDEDGMQVLGLSLCLVALASILIQVILLMRFQQLGRISAVGWLLPVGTAATAGYQCLSLWAIRQQDFRVLAKTKLTQAVGMVSAQIGLALAHCGAVGLVIGHIFGQGGGGFALSAAAKRTVHLKSITISGMWRAAVRYKRFPSLCLGAAALQSVTAALPLLFFSRVFDIRITGVLTLALGYISSPISLLNVTLGQVTNGEFADLLRNDPKRIRSVFLRRLKATVLVGVAIYLVYVLIVPPLIPIVFGARWKDGAICARILAPVLACSAIATPFGCLLDVLEHQGLALFRELVRASLVVAAFIVAILLHLDWHSALILYAGAAVAGYLVHIGISWRSAASCASIA